VFDFNKSSRNSDIKAVVEMKVTVKLTGNCQVECHINGNPILTFVALNEAIENLQESLKELILKHPELDGVKFEDIAKKVKSE